MMLYLVYPFDALVAQEKTMMITNTVANICQNLNVLFGFVVSFLDHPADNLFIENHNAL